MSSFTVLTKALTVAMLVALVLQFNAVSGL
jgi:hypothetical protein